MECKEVDYADYTSAILYQKNITDGFYFVDFSFLIKALVLIKDGKELVRISTNLFVEVFGLKQHQVIIRYKPDEIMLNQHNSQGMSLENFIFNFKYNTQHKELIDFILFNIDIFT